MSFLTIQLVAWKLIRIPVNLFVDKITQPWATTIQIMTVISRVECKRWRITCWRIRLTRRCGFLAFYPSCLLSATCCRYSGELEFIDWGSLFIHTYAHIRRSSQSAFYKVLISNAATSALRLHQRLPPIQFTKEFLALLLVEDSCHYLFFSLIFLYVQPFVLVLFPVVLFAVLHSASYSLKVLDVSSHAREIREI